MACYKEGFLNQVPKESGFELIKQSLSNNKNIEKQAFLNCELAERPKTDQYVFAEVLKPVTIRLDGG